MKGLILRGIGFERLMPVRGGKKARMGLILCYGYRHIMKLILRAIKKVPRQQK